MDRSMKKILVVDDEEAVCWSLDRALTGQGHRVFTAGSAEEALVKAEKERPDAIILDVRLPRKDGLSVLGRLQELTGGAPIIVITAYGNLTTAVGAVERGGFDYLVKPFDLDQALETVTRALQIRALPVASPGNNGLLDADEILGRSPAMQVVFKRIALVAARDSCVLITGESGTGKELAARAIHRHSARRDRPFLPVHIAALNPSLVESELFGHVKGAFTGATESRPGLFALADGGTIFLDESADIPLSVQAKLLRVLDHNEILPVGGNQSHRLNVRILSATHQDLQRRVAEGNFRHDLFFRASVFQSHIPPILERGEDILPLAEHFLSLFEPRALPLEADTARFLTELHWFGNVRELRNALEHAVIVARGSPLSPHHFPPLLSAPSAQSSSEALASLVQKWLQERIAASSPLPPANLFSELLECVEPALLQEVIRRVQGNRWVAAKWLGLNRATVRKKLARYNLTHLHQAQAQANPIQNLTDGPR
jgi:two-component system nitrogen regulation response regulator GlnG